MAWRTMEARYGVPTPCYWCGADATWSRSAGYRPGVHGGQLDHVVPVAAGGDEWDVDNIVPSCQPCNSDRGAHLGPPRRVQMTKPPPSRVW
jgi:5-methylcytosine-specific restriction endonuclease McrA